MKGNSKILVDKGANVLITGRSEERLLAVKEYTGAKHIVFDIANIDIYILKLKTV